MRSLRSAVLALFASSVLFAAGPLLEKDVDVPRATRIDVGLVWEKCTLIDVESHNAPDEKMVQSAKANDPKDLTFLLMRFRYGELRLGRPPGARDGRPPGRGRQRRR